MDLCLAALTSELRDIAMELSQQLRTNSGTEVEVIHILAPPSCLVQMPSGPRKSGSPDSVLIPAPVKTTRYLDSNIQ